jgi:hypothetical protein
MTAHAHAASPSRCATLDGESPAPDALDLQEEVALLRYCTGGVPVISLSPAAVCAVRDGLRRVLGALGDLTLIRTISALPVEETTVLFERPLEQVWDRIGRSFERLAQVASDPTSESTWAEVCRGLARNALTLSPCLDPDGASPPSTAQPHPMEGRRHTVRVGSRRHAKKRR